MSWLFEVALEVKVSDPQALWRKAKEYLVGCNSMLMDAESDDLIGSEAKPDIGGCLMMLLDRSEHLDGAEIQQSDAIEFTLGED